MVFTIDHDMFILEAYFRSGQQDENGVWYYSILSSHNQFQERFPDENIAYNDTFVQHVRRIVARFRESGSVAKNKTGGRPTVLTDNVVQDIRQRMDVSPTKSLRKLSAQTEISYGTCQKAVKKILHMHPYRLTSVQELLPPDFEKRTRYCNWFNQNINDNILDLTFFSDEAWFHLSGYINSQNFRIWSTENPHEFRETPLHPVKIGVWIAMSRRRVFGPIFFEENINAQNYRDLILRPFIEQLHDDEISEGYFQQDGATAHTANATLQFLGEYFDERVISKNLWPPRSPDLTPLDYFMFGYLKNMVFKNRIHNLDHLKETITNCVENITEQMLINVFNSMKNRVNLCLEQNGEHFQHLLM